MSTARGKFTESLAPVERDELLNRRIGDLRLQLGGTRLERLVERLYDELARAGLAFRPPVYLSDDWGCPDRVPIIGVPFYLADPELTRLHDQMMEGVEAESDDDIMRYLRHEAGHAFTYAYRLYETKEWTELFGPFARPYPDDYTPQPFSRSFVRHLPAWYAQKHPDEDSAETFAVWLDPASNWRETYADWSCLTKLHYFERLAKTIGSQPPPLTAESYDTRESFLADTVTEYYRRLTPSPIRIPQLFDAALRDVFRKSETGPEADAPAAEFIHRWRRSIVGAVHYWTGLDDVPIRALLDHLEGRCTDLGLRIGGAAESRLVEFTALVTTLCMNRLRTGDFVGK